MESNINSTNVEKAKSKEFSVKDFILGMRSIFSLLLKKWKIILLFAIIGAILGGLYAYNQKTLYSAEAVFVLDEASPSATGGLALLGLGKKDADLFSVSDNIIWLYSSNLMLQKTLLTTVKKEGKDIVLINWFIDCDSTGLKRVINKNKILKAVRFDVGESFDSLSIEQNSILGSCIGLFKSKCLKVKTVDKTENIISVNTTSPDEKLTKVLNDVLVKTVNDYYIETKTQKTSKEVIALQLKVDSFKQRLNTSMYQAASASDDVPYANPNQLVLRVAPQKKTTDVQLESAVYIEAARSLEASKIALSKETPLIQVIDAPSYPLNGAKMAFSKGVMMGVFLFSFLTIAILVTNNWIKEIMNN